MGDERKKSVLGPLNSMERREAALQLRHIIASLESMRKIPNNMNNGDEELYINKIGNYTKALPHNGIGEVHLNAYEALLKALESGDPKDFKDIPMGNPNPVGIIGLLKNPQSSYAYEMVGMDSQYQSCDSTPTFSSAWEASEMGELCWLALTRDVPYINYDTNRLIQEAVIDMSRFSDFRGPKVNGKVTSRTLFRGDTHGDQVGPYISQFLLKDIPYGSTPIIQRYRTTNANDDFMTNYQEWLNIQNGFPPSKKNNFDPILRYIRNNRDLAEWVHYDFPFQGSLNACLILLGLGGDALDPASPYKKSKTECGFVTFGAPHYLDFTARAARLGLEACWYQKWLVHRRLRPEAFGGFVHNQLTGLANYPINTEILNSQAVSKTFSKYGSYLLPQAFPEGSPSHPSFPSGHASFIGAGVTVLKAIFDESYVIPNPVQASADGLSLIPYTGPALTVGGELNKLAANIGLGRDAGGVHWRTDITNGLLLGESCAIGLLSNYSRTYNEDFTGFSLTKFDGTKISINSV